jgi:hypothetical protein
MDKKAMRRSVILHFTQTDLPGRAAAAKSCPAPSEK